MGNKLFYVFIPVVIAFAMLSSAQLSFADDDAKEKSAGNLFIEAFLEKDKEEMKELIEKRTEEFPPEVQAMVEYAMSGKVSPEDQDFLFNVAGNISMMYAEHTGDERLLGAVQANYEKVIASREKSPLSPEGKEAVKKALVEMGKGAWRVIVIKLDQKGELVLDIDVRESTGGKGFTPRITLQQSKEATEIVKKILPDIKKGKISWSSMGVGLKVAFIE